MPTWDVFHSDRLEVERGLDDAAVRASVARGDLTEDDLIRPAGSGSPWERLGDRLGSLAVAEPEPEEVAPEPPPPPPVEAPRPVEATEWGTEALDRLGWKEHEVIDEDVNLGDLASGPDFEQVDPELSVPAMRAFALVEDDDEAPPGPSAGPILPPLEKSAAIPVPGPAPLPFDEEELEAEFDGEDEYDPLEEDEAVAEFTLARGSAETVEELDLAAMVDVAFQLVLFFLVTATTVFYKSLEVPKPNTDAPPEAAQQSRSTTLEDKMKDFILVEIDRSGALKIDRQPVEGTLTRPALVERLRKLREDTGRKSMLLSADFVTPHAMAVIAYDAANEIGMGISIARPAPPGEKTGATPVKKG